MMPPLKKIRRAVVALAGASLLASAGLFAQANSGAAVPLQSSSMMRIIQEESRIPDRVTQRRALEDIRYARDGGLADTGELVKVLEYIALEGIVHRSYDAAGRLANNFPEVRLLAVQLLAEMGIPEARQSLLKVMNIETDTMILTGAIQSLIKIGTNEHNDAVFAVNAIMKRVDSLLPDDRLVFAALDAYDQFYGKAGETQDDETILLIMQIRSSPYYVKTVRDRAEAVLRNIFALGQ
jgi:hypothetical protein